MDAGVYLFTEHHEGFLMLNTEKQTYWSEVRLSEETGLSRSFWRQQRMKGTGPKYLKIGSRVLYRSNDIEGWMKARESQNTIYLKV